VLAAGLEGGGDAEDLVPVEPVGTDDVHDDWLVAGEGSGLVERDAADAVSGDAVAGSHDHDVAHDELRRVDVALHSAAADGDGVGHEIEQGA